MATIAPRRRRRQLKHSPMSCRISREDADQTRLRQACSISCATQQVHRDGSCGEVARVTSKAHRRDQMAVRDNASVCRPTGEAGHSRIRTGDSSTRGKAGRPPGSVAFSRPVSCQMMGGEIASKATGQGSQFTIRCRPIEASKRPLLRGCV